MDLARRVDEIERRIESDATVRAASEAMADTVTNAVRAALGGDLAMSGLRGSRARIETSTRAQTAVVTVSGAAFTLADKGRRRAVPARARARSALRTPWGPRAAVDGSTTRGKDIIGTVARRAFEAGADAATSAAFGGR